VKFWLSVSLNRIDCSYAYCSLTRLDSKRFNSRNMNPNISSVLVTGDIVVDRHIYKGERTLLPDQSPRGTHLLEEAGGAAITQRLITAVFETDLKERRALWKEAVRKARKDRKKLPSEPEEPPVCRLACKLPGKGTWPEQLTGYACWTPQPKPKSKDQVWRVSESFGYGPLNTSAGSASKASQVKTSSYLRTANNLPRNPGIVVLDDAGESFRQKEQNALWHLPHAAQAAALPAWIVLKLAGPIGQGDLWDKLMTCQPRQRLVILTSARLLRRVDVRLSQGLSWERTVEHLRQELDENPAIRQLGAARHLIVNFEGDGAIWIDFSRSDQPNARLVFDAQHAEGEWASGLKGGAFGYLTCLTAAVVWTLVSSSEENVDLDFQSAIERGLSAMRSLRTEGHGIAISEKGGFHLGRGFPTAQLADEILHPTQRFARAAVPWNALEGQGESPVQWSILASLQNPSAPTQPLFGFARQLAIQGPAVLAHVPHLRVGELLIASRDEMETLRSLRRILRAYRDTGSSKQPLSIGVFGAPGAGKSFGVQQLAIGIFGEPGAESYPGWMEFNLSQFDDSKDLIGAFHQVRDRVLQGMIPIVFWDEFDSREYHWLQYLLAPMQDGRFQQGQITHTLGKCVFVLAGGTAETFEEFGPQEERMRQQFKLAKGPDFKSRLDGYLNVLGPNQSGVPAGDGATRIGDDMDIFFPVRRALIIRNVLGCKEHERLEIDPGLLNALLEIKDYKHGARSLKKILEPLRAARKESRARLRRSQVPAPNQLSLHVNIEEFHALCSRDLPFKTDEIIQKLAPAVHDAWREIARNEGWKSQYDLTYDELPLDIKRSNEAAARRIPDIIALVGLQVVPGLAAPEEESRVREQLERHLEALAEEEHNGWMDHLYSEGWKFAETRDDHRRLHNCLRPFHELRESDKEKDRNSVRHYPDFVQKAGFKVVFI